MHDNERVGSEGAGRFIPDFNNEVIDPAIFEVLFTNNPAVSFISDSGTGNILLANQAACHFYGYSQPEFAKMKLDQINSSVEETSEPDFLLLREGSPRFYFKHMLKSGETKYVDLHSYKFQLKEKKLIYTIINDVTRQIRSELSFHEIDGKYKALVNNSFEGILIIDFEGTIFFINHAIEEILALPEREITGRKVYEFLAPESMPRVIEDFGKVMSGIDSYVSEYKCINGRGEELWLNSIGKIISFDNRVAILISLRDITRQKMADEALKESEERFRRLMQEVQHVSIQGYALDGTARYWNEASENLFGYSAEEAIGKNLLELIIPPFLKDDVSIALQKMAETGIPSPASELKLMRKDGTLVEVFSSRTIVKIPGKQPEFFCIDIDLTERKKIENELIIARDRAQESDRLKTAFLQNMSHEIRTPMNAIIGFTELVYKNLDNKAKVENFIQIINQRCEDLLMIIDDILNVAKIESCQLLVNPENFNLISLFTDLKLLFIEHQSRFKKSHISLGVVSEVSATDLNVITDKGKLRQIFVNLIGNAFKFTNKGKIEFGCKVNESEQLVFFVSDTGIGIPKDKYDYIFERFAQLDQSEKKALGGNGLGLSIVKGLVNLLGGKVWLESEVGKGSIFYFTIN